jgi:competence protein ComFC
MITCKVCFSPIRHRHLFQWHRPPLVCSTCQHQLEWHHQLATFEGFPIESFLDYGPLFKSRIHQYKALGDMELGKTFLHQHRDYLRLKYRGFTFLPAPSHRDHIVGRGFHHLDEMLVALGFPLLHVFYKNKAYRQAEQDYHGRQGIHDVIQRHADTPLPRKLVLFDDVMTTGETIRSMTRQLPIHEKFELKIIVLARKIETNSRLQSSSKMLK